MPLIVAGGEGLGMSLPNSFQQLIVCKEHLDGTQRRDGGNERSWKLANHFQYGGQGGDESLGHVWPS